LNKSVPQVALVTGSGRKRIGSFIARALAERGYVLAIHYRSAAAEAADTVHELSLLGAGALAFQADLSHETGARGLIDEVVQRFGRIDALINCAAIWEPKRLEDVTASDVRRHFDVNTLGAFLCAQHAGLLMVRQEEGGCIVNIGDWAVARPYVDHAAYFVSKGSIETMSRCLAVELGARNPRVRVNCLLPGPVMLPPDLPEAERRRVIDSTLAKSEGHPQDVARAVMFLVDSPFITGASLPIDGGRTIYAGGL
jgi:pteridine reductase